MLGFEVDLVLGVVLNELDDSVWGEWLVDFWSAVEGFLPKPKRRANQEVDDGEEGLEVEVGDDATAAVDCAVVAVDVDRVAAVGEVALVAKARWVVSTTSPSSSLQKEGERVFLGLSSINSD